MQTFTVAKQYLYYRFSLAFITYALLLLLGYFYSNTLIIVIIFNILYSLGAFVLV